MAKAAAIFVLVVLVVAVAAGGASAACDAGNLSVCAIPILTGVQPSASCCSSLRGQRGCFCQYARNPAYATYVNSVNARKTLTSCGIAAPRC